MIKLSYAEVMNMGFATAVQKISQTPTHGQKAAQIHKITKKLFELRQSISKEFQDKVVSEFAKKDEKGVILRPEGEPNGFDCVEGREEELDKAQQAFGETVAELNIPFISLELISDMKVSATDLEALKGLYSGNAEGPGVPQKLKSV